MMLRLQCSEAAFYILQLFDRIAAHLQANKMKDTLPILQTLFSRSMQNPLTKCYSVSVSELECSQRDILFFAKQAWCAA